MLEINNLHANAGDQTDPARNRSEGKQGRSPCHHGPRTAPEKARWLMCWPAAKASRHRRIVSYQGKNLIEMLPEERAPREFFLPFNILLEDSRGHEHTTS